MRRNYLTSIISSSAWERRLSLWLFSLHCVLSWSLSGCPSSFFLFHPPPIRHHPAFPPLENKIHVPIFPHSRSHIPLDQTLAWQSLQSVTLGWCIVLLPPTSKYGAFVLEGKEMRGREKWGEDEARSTAKPKLDSRRPGARVASGRAVLPIQSRSL